MKAAVYARKSNEQNDVADINKSVTRQKELARQFAASRGWTVVAEFEDDGISGAEFERRPGFQHLLRSLHPRPAFDILIVAEQKAIGRETYDTQHTIKRLAQAGVEIWAYMDGRCLPPRNWLDKAMASVRSWADEAHREDTALRTHEAHLEKAKRGFVVGGRVFGYRNQHVFNGVDVHGNPLRVCTRRVIDPDEAAVVRKIFELYDSGLGLKSIAKHLTLERAVQPKSPHPSLGWASATVRDILCRELYRGVVVWNRTKKRDNWGQVKQRARPADEWMQTVDETLRIIPDQLWKRGASRRKDTEGKAIRFSSGRMSGRPPKTAVQNLLAGLAACGVCGGGLVVETSSRKGGRVAEYVCYRHRHNSSVCANSLRMPVDEMHEAVLQAVEEHVFTPEAIEQVIALTERDDLRERQNQLRAESQDVTRRIARLTAVLETDGAGVASIVAKLRALEQRQVAIRGEMESLQPVPRLPQPVVQSTLDEWRRLLRGSPTQGRAVLQRVIQGRITFTPTKTVVCTPGGVHLAHPGYEFQAPTRFDKLFTGTAIKVPASAPYSGDVPEMTFAEDADYGAMLERAYGNGGQRAIIGVPNGIRTRVLALKGIRRPFSCRSAPVRFAPQVSANQHRFNDFNAILCRGRRIAALLSGAVGSAAVLPILLPINRQGRTSGARPDGSFRGTAGPW
jgi:DNA invertase Pin-like site-specific DNA recombinase